MRFIVWFTAVIIGISALAGCSLSQTPVAQPVDVQRTSVIAEVPVSPTPSTTEPRLHWTAQGDKPVELENLRRAYEGNGFGLFQAGFVPVSEHVDNPASPTVLVTTWIHGKADVIVETHSHYGIAAVTLKKSSGTNKDAKSAWYRCDVPGLEGMEADFQVLIKRYQGLRARAFTTACHEVLYR